MHEIEDVPQEFIILPLVQPTPDATPINRARIKELCSAGLSECPVEDRCIAWLVLLEVFPANPLEWPNKRALLVDTYQTFVREFGVSDWHEKEIPDHVTPRYFSLTNDRVMWTIHADVCRTLQHIAFFPPDCEAEDAGSFLGAHIHHMRRIERILYIFASVNPTLSYLQGFNELCAPLYFVNNAALHYLGDDPDEAEALSFACLNNLINGTEVNSFYTTMDNSSIIRHKMNRFVDLMRVHLPEVQAVLDAHEIHPLQYCFKWFSLLFAQEHQQPTLLIIWDSLFAHYEDLMNYVSYVTIAHIEELKPKLLAPCTFAELMEGLQRPRVRNIFEVLKRADDFYRADHAPSLRQKILSLFNTLSKF
jgi:hypothetical protein